MSDPERINISREALRADLLALELRLTEKLAVKADAIVVSGLVDRVAGHDARLVKLEATDPRSAMGRIETRIEAIEDAALNPDSVAALIGEALRQNQARGWTTRERLLQAAVALSGLATFAMLASTRVG